MSVNNIASSDFSFYTFCPKAISEETKRKLISLGIDPSSVTSETQAQNLIMQAQIQQINEIIIENTITARNSVKSESSLIASAKELAGKIGLNISNTESLSEILEKTSIKLKEIQANKKSEEKQNNLFKNLQEEFENIQNQASTVQQNQNSMFTAMNATANMNKYLLKINQA